MEIPDQLFRQKSGSLQLFDQFAVAYTVISPVLLPININDLLGAKTVESNRIEYKEGWNPDAIYRSICAFANDFDNSGGGYIVIGVAEEQGRAKRPVKGLTTEQIARIQQEMIGYNNQIKPPYHPRLFIEEIDGQQIIILWVLGSASRPHEVPENVGANQKIYRYYIRQYANSVRANAEQQQELIAMTNQVPFDDRPNTQAAMADISLLWIREYLRIARARLFEQASTLSTTELLDQMELLSGPPEFRFPRNVALMLFCETPEKFFPYTFIELVDFRRGSGSKTFTEYTFRGPVQYQIRQLMDKLRTLILIEMVIKVDYQAESLRPWSYPIRAVEEAVANCIYHRDYQRYDPIRVYIYQNRLVFQNGGGPDRAIRLEDFQTGRVQPRHYRNRRLGSFLKALQLTEGYATGIRLILDEMARNGSVPPLFSMDEERTYFAVEFTLHPAFVANDFGPSRLNPDSDEFTGMLLEQASMQILQNLTNQPPMKRRDILEGIGLTNHPRNAERYLTPLLTAELVMQTVKDRPKSPQQRYVLTDRGRAYLQQQSPE